MVKKIFNFLGLSEKDNKTVLVLIIGFMFLLFFICKYNNSKSNTFDYMDHSEAPIELSNSSNVGVSGKLEELPEESELRGSEVPPGTGNTHGLPPMDGIEKHGLNAQDLLPHNNEAQQWSEKNSDPGGVLNNVNLLPAGSIIGVNTVGQTLRNANLQLRAEPPNPKLTTGPWNNSTIDPNSTNGIKQC